MRCTDCAALTSPLLSCPACTLLLHNAALSFSSPYSLPIALVPAYALVLSFTLAVQDIFKALCDCAALNPDAEEEGERVKVGGCGGEVTLNGDLPAGPECW